MYLYPLQGDYEPLEGWDCVSFLYTLYLSEADTFLAIRKCLMSQFYISALCSFQYFIRKQEMIPFISPVQILHLCYQILLGSCISCLVLS